MHYRIESEVTMLWHERLVSQFFSSISPFFTLQQNIQSWNPRMAWEARNYLNKFSFFSEDKKFGSHYFHDIVSRGKMRKSARILRHKNFTITARWILHKITLTFTHTVSWLRKDKKSWKKSSLPRGRKMIQCLWQRIKEEKCAFHKFCLLAKNDLQFSIFVEFIKHWRLSHTSVIRE